MAGLIFESEREISSAFIDSSVKLGIAQAALLVQDNLTDCFDMLGCDGVRYLDLNVFWVFTKARFRFAGRPNWRDTISARTFPVSNAGFKTNVNTVLSKDGIPFLFANQEACVLDKETHRPVRLASLPYPKDGFPGAEFSEPFERFAVPQADFSEAFTQPVRSQNIDMSGHMNNNEYIKLALSAFPDSFLRGREPELLEVHYTGESTEGQLLRVLKAQQDGAFFVNIAEGGRTVFEMKAAFAAGA
ncbi:MAG: hypothetical protein K2H09_02225 [Treponemataceae bacterium]|nr:hypothetical protein [Treponemataceae bacterium]